MLKLAAELSKTDFTAFRSQTLNTVVLCLLSFPYFYSGSSAISGQVSRLSL